VTTTRGRVIAAIEQVAERLGPDLGGVVFVGATAAALYGDAGPSDIRPTNDVDVLTDEKLPGYYALLARLKGRGFKESREEGAPICRLELEDLLVDVLVLDPAVLGFSNRWYPEAFRKAAFFRLPSGKTVRGITPVYFLATKLVAFAARGGGNPTGSKDVEDLVNLFSSRPGTIREVAEGTGGVFEFVRTELRRLLASDSFEDAIFGCFLPDEANQQRAALLVAELRQRFA
jgi:hypothetical protein